VSEDATMSGDVPPETEPSDAPPEEPKPTRAPHDDPLRRSRTSGLWIAVVGLGLLLVLLIVFIIQNTQRVEVSVLGWDGRPPLAVALLVAAAAGLLLSAIAGSLRILQLRRRVKRGA
jgi:uncharacterized integral membrane protein